MIASFILSIFNNSLLSTSKAIATLNAEMFSLGFVEVSESNDIKLIVVDRNDWIDRDFWPIDTGYPINLIDSTEKSSILFHLSRFGHKSSAITVLAKPKIDSFLSN